MPVRLSLLLLGAVILSLLSIGNPQIVTIQFLFWRQSFALYKIILGSVFLGVLFTVIYSGHVRYIRRIRQDRYDRDY
ncbi:MAG: LapA family protein [Leptospiraceae bacterium]|nr:LapA family protein [Leptospiraceae bacterium]